MTTYEGSDILVSTEWLAENLENPNFCDFENHREYKGAREAMVEEHDWRGYGSKTKKT